MPGWGLLINNRIEVIKSQIRCRDVEAHRGAWGHVGQHAVGYRPRRRRQHIVQWLKILDLMLVESFRLAFPVIDFNRSAVAADADDAGRLPVQAVQDVESGRVRQVRVAMGDH